MFDIDVYKSKSHFKHHVKLIILLTKELVALKYRKSSKTSKHFSSVFMKTHHNSKS